LPVEGVVGSVYSDLVGGAGHGPVVIVDAVVVSAAKQYEIVWFGGPVVFGPVADVVGLAEVGGHVALGPDAAAVAGTEDVPVVVVGGADGAAFGEGGEVAEQDRGGGAVAQEALGVFDGDGGAVVEFAGGAGVAFAGVEGGVVDVDDEVGEGSAAGLGHRSSGELDEGVGEELVGVFGW
jgi:hypothetical protein